MTPDAKLFHELWQSAERELEEWGPNGRSTKDIFDELIRRLNYDGQDIDSLTIGEIRRALPAETEYVARPISGSINEEVIQNAKRYLRLRILGVAPAYTGHLERGEVMRFTNLDEFVDHDIGFQSRGEHHPQS